MNRIAHDAPEERCSHISALQFHFQAAAVRLIVPVECVTTTVSNCEWPYLSIWMAWPRWWFICNQSPVLFSHLNGMQNSGHDKSDHRDMNGVCDKKTWYLDLTTGAAKQRQLLITKYQLLKGQATLPRGLNWTETTRNCTKPNTAGTNNAPKIKRD